MTTRIRAPFVAILCSNRKRLEDLRFLGDERPLIVFEDHPNGKPAYGCLCDLSTPLGGPK